MNNVAASYNFMSTNAFTFDPWHEFLAVLLAHDHVYSRCGKAHAKAWPLVYARLQQLLAYVDPNEQPHHETTSRTSILFGVGANSLEKMRRAASEREANLAL